MMTLIEDLKQSAREMPWFVAAVALLVVMGIGVDAEILNTADGDQARLCIGRADTPATPGQDVAERKAYQCAMSAKSGLTVLIGIERYRVEMTIPEAAVKSRLATMRMNLG